MILSYRVKFMDWFVIFLVSSVTLTCKNKAVIIGKTELNVSVVTIMELVLGFQFESIPDRGNGMCVYFFHKVVSDE